MRVTLALLIAVTAASCTGPDRAEQTHDSEHGATVLIDPGLNIDHYFDTRDDGTIVLKKGTVDTATCGNMADRSPEHTIDLRDLFADHGVRDDTPRP